jgi:DNA-directed RNA polymerase specialized sigma24 family protein
LFGAGPVAGLEDRALLERFTDLEGDAAEAAFAALVARHGPMVRRVCRRLLDDPHDADDAFQADLAESFEARGADAARRFEFAIFVPSYLESLRRAGHRRIAQEAATLFEKVKADYGDVTYVSSVTPTGETLATAADRERADIRTLAIGQAAPEIDGTSGSTRLSSSSTAGA